MAGTLDWCAVAASLAEQSPRPVVILDSRGKIRLFNEPAEKLLGWQRYEVVGLRASRLLAPGQDRASARQWLKEALHGALRSLEARVVTQHGDTLAVELSITPIGADSGRNLLVTVTASRPVDIGCSSRACVEYEVVHAPGEFGLLTGGCSRAGIPRGSQPRCYAHLYQRGAPCPRCPLLREGNDPWPRASVLRLGGGRPVLVQASKTAATRFRLTAVVLGEQSADGILHWKLEEAAARAGLSKREQDVLRYLVMGRAPEDIATILGIGKRTVKFHQANLLAKLGAESRHDLIRLVL